VIFLLLFHIFSYPYRSDSLTRRAGLTGATLTRGWSTRLISFVPRSIGTHHLHPSPRPKLARWHLSRRLNSMASAKSHHSFVSLTISTGPLRVAKSTLRRTLAISAYSSHSPHAIRINMTILPQNKAPSSQSLRSILHRSSSSSETL
jgi:hypothetical protein